MCLFFLLIYCVCVWCVLLFLIAAISLNTCIRNASGSYRYRCAAGATSADADVVTVEEFVDVHDCSGDAVMSVRHLTGQCESYSYFDGGSGAVDNYKSMCDASSAPWEQYGSAYLMTR